MDGLQSGFDRNADAIILRRGGDSSEMIAMSQALQKSLSIEALERSMTELEAGLRGMPSDIMEMEGSMLLSQGTSKRAAMKHLGEVFLLRDLLNLRSRLPCSPSPPFPPFLPLKPWQPNGHEC